MDGTGYPRGLRADQMSVQARMMAIADIFEALTAKDRPYKTGKTLSESLRILGRFRQRNHIDPNLFDVFVRSKVYLTFAQRFMDPALIDEVDVNKIPGYVP
jgi:HD-GYP domain-containing protein (c-di-GMP phosphodiesterase class II)